MGAGIAGRVMPIPRGKYDSTALYSILDIVSHNNQLWMCRESNIQGIEPNETNSDKWMHIVSGTDADDFYDKTASDNRYAKLSKAVNISVPASGWAGSAAPYTNIVTVEGVTLDNLVYATYDPSTITDAEIAAYVNADIHKITQGANILTLYASKTKPTINLPMTVVIKGDM